MSRDVPPAGAFCIYGGKIMQLRIKKIVQIILGLAILGFSTMLSRQFGSLNPWNVLNDGISKVLHITIGQANIGVGILILCIDILAKEKLGIGTVLNAFGIGIFTDIFIALNTSIGLVPKVTNVFMQIPLCIMCIVISSFGIYFYMSAQMGSGPRDSLMLAITKRVPYPVGVCRMAMEGVAFVIGALLGGAFGVGTFVSVLCAGPIMQKICKMVGYDIKKTKNESFAETFAFLKEYFAGKKVGA